MNACEFSPCRTYRYTLRRDFALRIPERKPIMWIGLNPSTADETKLDPTLRRIESFSAREGFTSFIMTNLFAYRSTDSRVLHKMRVEELVGPENDRWLLATALACDCIMFAWGAHSAADTRAQHVRAMLAPLHKPLACVGRTQAGYPRHPLYVPASAIFDANI